MKLPRQFAFWKRKDELRQELDSHLRMAIADRVAAGQPPEVARQAALREFGNLPLVQDVASSMWRWSWLERLLEDVRYALRQIRRSPAFAVSVIGTMALGIGAAMAMFTVVDHMLLQPVPYKDPSRLVLMQETDGKAFTNGAPWPDIEQWMQASHSFAGIAFSGSTPGRQFLEARDGAWEISAKSVSSNLFTVLGVQPRLGPGFSSELPAFVPGKNAGKILLSDAVWKGAFGGDASIIGKVVRVNSQPYTVSGIMPPGFTFPADAFNNRRAQVWMPLSLGEDERLRDDNSHAYTVIARLNPGSSLERARAEIAAIQKRLAPLYTNPYARSDHEFAKLEIYGGTLVGKNVRKALLTLLAASAILWLIACVNATNLLLARSTARQRETALRGALGASRARIVQQIVVESLVLSGAAALIGCCFALGSVKALEHELTQQLPLPASATIDGSMLLLLIALSVASGLTAALWPAFRAMHAPIEPELRQGGTRTGTTTHHRNVRSSLIAIEVALSLTLLVGCGLLLRTIYALRNVPLGYRTDHILVAQLSIPSYRFSGKNIIQTLYVPLLDRVRGIGGVQVAGLMNEVPLGHNFRTELALQMNGHTIRTSLKLVSPEMQQIFGQRMLAGRFFNAQDSPTSQPAVLVNPAFVRAFAPDRHDPASLLGTPMWNLRKDAPFQIVGVLENELQVSPAEPSQPEVDVCLCQITPEAGAYGPSTIAVELAMRTERATQEIIPELRAELRKASPELQNAPITTMSQIVEESFGSQQLAAHLLEVFAGLALLLSMTGLYGLLAYLVTQRTHEMGVRIALGASRVHLLWLVMRQAAAMLVLGLAAGVAIAWASARLLRDFLYGVHAHDGATLAAAATLLSVSGLIAAYYPAWRAANTDAIEALRTE